MFLDNRSWHYTYLVLFSQRLEFFEICFPVAAQLGEARILRDP